MPQLPYQEGDCFAVPLRSGGYGVGVVVRMSPRGKILFGYFFGPALPAPPKAAALAGLSPTDAVLVARFGDLSLFNGEWPVLGQLPHWDRTHWLMPPFQRVESLRGTARLIIYADDDPAHQIASEPLEAPRTDLEPDRLMGAGAVELALTKRLAR